MNFIAATAETTYDVICLVASSVETGTDKFQHGSACQSSPSVTRVGSCLREQRINDKFCLKLQKNAKETH